MSICHKQYQKQDLMEILSICLQHDRKFLDNGLFKQRDFHWILRKINLLNWLDFNTTGLLSSYHPALHWRSKTSAPPSFLLSLLSSSASLPLFHSLYSSQLFEVFCLLGTEDLDRGGWSVSTQPQYATVGKIKSMWRDHFWSRCRLHHGPR